MVVLGLIVLQVDFGRAAEMPASRELHDVQFVGKVPLASLRGIRGIEGRVQHGPVKPWIELETLPGGLLYRKCFRWLQLQFGHFFLLGLLRLYLCTSGPGPCRLTPPGCQSTLAI